MKLTSAMARAGYGSARPFLSADVLHSSQPPCFTTPSRFLTILSQTPFHSRTSLPGTSL